LIHFALFLLLRYYVCYFVMNLSKFYRCICCNACRLLKFAIRSQVSKLECPTVECRCLLFSSGGAGYRREFWLLSISVLHVRPFRATEYQIGHSVGEGRGRQWATAVVGGDHARRSSDQSNPRDLDIHSLAGSHDWILCFCVWKMNTCCIKHVGMYIATTFTGNRMDIFLGTDRKWLWTDGQTKEMRLCCWDQWTWSSRKPIAADGLVACT